MLKVAFLAVLLMTAVMVAMTLLAVIVVLAFIAALVVPMFVLGRRWAQPRAQQLAVKPIERLQNLYAEGKIDLFEFETRIAHLIALER